MYVSNNPLAPREKNRVSTSQEQRVSTSQEQRVSPQDSSFLRPKEMEKKSQTSMSQETEETLVPPINVTDEEVLKRYESYRDNPGYYDGDNILINTTNMLSPSTGLFEVAGSIDSAGNIGSQKDPTSDEPEMMPSISIDGIDLATFFADPTEEDSQLPYDNLEGLGILGEGSGIDTTCLFKNKSNIAFSSFGSIESMMNAKIEREKIVMIPTPTVNDAPQMIPAPTANDAPQWTITKKLAHNDIYPLGRNTLFLQERSVDELFRRHMPVAEFQRIVRDSVVDVYDYDSRTMHKLRLRLTNGRNYALTGGWFGDFIQRRSLRINDEIGFLWDSSASRLVFGVISRAQKKPRRKSSKEKRI